MHSHRHAGPKSTQYNELEKMINQYYEMLQKKQDRNANRFAVNIRKHILLYSCPEDDIIAETNYDKQAQHQPSERRLLTRIGRALPTIRRVEDTLRGKLWRLVLGIGNLDANDYKNQIKKAESPDYYVKIRGDTKRTFLTSEEYNSRVSQERLVRVLNSFVHRYNKPYCQGMDAIAAGLLYVMPELDAFQTFSCLINQHFPTYFYSDIAQRKKDLIGAYAASYLSWDILSICDTQIFNHLKPLPAHTYFFPLVASFQAISQPFTELQRLWDFMFCFGVHLNPCLAAAQIITNKKLIMTQNPARLLQGLLSQRKWMKSRVNAKKVIDATMYIITHTLKQEKHKKLWQNILLHTNNFEIALQIKIQHENGISSQLYKTITSAITSQSQNSDSNSTAQTVPQSVPPVMPDQSPDLKRFKTRSEENFGDFNGRSSLREIVEEHDKEQMEFSAGDDDEDYDGDDMDTKQDE